MRRFLLLGLLSLQGCYYVRQGTGQIDILLNRRDVADVLSDPAINDVEKARLRLIEDIKRFGEVEIGLTAGDNYTTYYRVGEGHISTLVSACAKDSFRPFVWSFPIVGALPYKGFFNRDDAVAEARELERRGFDVSMHPVSAYSTLGWFSDPVFSTMLRMDEEDLASLILHELTHGTLFVEGDADFNESLASFVGSTASLQYLRMRFGTDSEPYRRAVDGMADRERYAAFIEEMHRKLSALYDTPVSRTEKLRVRTELFDSFQRQYREVRTQMRTPAYAAGSWPPRDNAELLADRRYMNEERFQKVFDEADRRWPEFWRLIRAMEGGGRVPHLTSASPPP